MSKQMKVWFSEESDYDLLLEKLEEMEMEDELEGQVAIKEVGSE